MNLFTGCLESKNIAYLYLMTIKNNVTWLFVYVNVYRWYSVHNLKQFYEGDVIFKNSIFKKNNSS